jgi:hypothetical protein
LLFSGFLDLAIIYNPSLAWLEQVTASSLSFDEIDSRPASNYHKRTYPDPQQIGDNNTPHNFGEEESLAPKMIDMPAVAPKTIRVRCHASSRAGQVTLRSSARLSEVTRDRFDEAQVKALFGLAGYFGHVRLAPISLGPMSLHNHYLSLTMQGVGSGSVGNIS